MFILFLFLTVFFSINLASEPAFQSSPNFHNITDFSIDRLAFHYSNQLDSKNRPLKTAVLSKDTSESTLLVIKDGEIYLLKDGYDDIVDVKRKRDEYNEKLRNYAERVQFIREFEELDIQRTKRAGQVTSFGKSLEEYDDMIYKLLYRYDSILRNLNISLRQREEDEQVQLRSAGLNSFAHKQAKQKTEEARTKHKDRLEFLKSALRNHDKPDAKEKLPEVKFPGNEDDQDFFTVQTDGNPDYIAFARTHGVPDFMKIDKDGRNFVQTNYGKMFTELRTKLIQSHIDKYKFLLTHLNVTNSTFFVENLPVQNKQIEATNSEPQSVEPKSEKAAETGKQEPLKKQTEPAKSEVAVKEGRGKRLTLVGGDSTRYILIDADGDGQTESFYVQNNDIKFRWDKEVPNIISIQNCKDPAILGLIKDLLSHSITGEFGNIDESKKPQITTFIQAPEEELVSEVDTYLTKK
ncbi:MAG: hypothetical protein L6Q54_12300 [Leptospiraceae bacterium]|nr:hypothetical protein [Leptospiraceae bacterium]MCK6382013.1 hypothetical protein [Leptospiraceae bacterium]NUM40384.1 hypothetical protein [Leptospiraceae bacterium]